MKPGDVVVLESGGPLMTVEDLTESGAWVVWFSPETDEFHRVNMMPVTLRLVDLDEQDDDEAEEN